MIIDLTLLSVRVKIIQELKQMPIGLLTLEIQLPGCTSLKEKRSHIKPVISRLHREFNISVAEIGLHDHWQEAVIACVVISNDPAYCHKSLQTVIGFFESQFPELIILNQRIESF